jgi:hypothetical protein
MPTHIYTDLIFCSHQIIYSRIFQGCYLNYYAPPQVSVMVNQSSQIHDPAAADSWHGAIPSNEIPP